MYQSEKKSLKIVHGFVNDVIEKRRNEIIRNQQINESTGVKKRAALMEILLQSQMDGKPLSNADICGEVNTFMFAGVNWI